MEFLQHSPPEGRKPQFVGRVVGLSLCQAPTGIGNHSICTIIMSLVKDGPQASVWSLKDLVKSAQVRIVAMVHRHFRSLKDH